MVSFCKYSIFSYEISGVNCSTCVYMYMHNAKAYYFIQLFHIYVDSLFTWAFSFSIGNVKISNHNCSFIYLSVVDWYTLQWSHCDRVTPVTLCSGNIDPLSLSCSLSLEHTTQFLKVVSKKLLTGFGMVPERPANHYPWLNAVPRSLTGGNVLWGTLLGQLTKLESGW